MVQLLDVFAEGTELIIVVSTAVVPKLTLFGGRTSKQQPDLHSVHGMQSFVSDTWQNAITQVVGMCTHFYVSGIVAMPKLLVVPYHHCHESNQLRHPNT
jgi:hypothetical protein